VPDPSAPSLGRALALWAVLSVLFVFAGGLGAGVTALLYEWLVGDPFGDLLYAVIFGGIGLVAYRVAHRYAQSRRTGR
jgi:hypothetical protein